MIALRVLAAVATAGLLLLGIWVTGAAITNDFAVSMWLTAGWMSAAGAAALTIGLRNRSLRLPVLGAYLVTAAVAGGYLGLSTFVDDVVDEQVAQAAAGNTLVAAGTFQPVRHAATGRAHAIELARGGRVLTFTGFEVDNGPDLRVYLVAGPAREEGEVDEFVDLGALKGNKGNQQYRLPDSVDLARYSTVVVWCRAFSALFARATLT